MKQFYLNSVVEERRLQREGIKQAPVALFTDMDNTFYSPHLAAVSKQFSHVLEREAWLLAYVTGRPFHESVIPGMPKADIVAANLGTELYVQLKSGQYIQDYEYAALFRQWPAHEAAKAVRKALDLFPGLMVQPEYQGATVPLLRIGLYLFGTTEDLASFRAYAIQAMPYAAMTWTRDTGVQKKYDIDLVPILTLRDGTRIFGKHLAVHYLRRRFQMSGVVAGDSLTDREMLVESGLPAIVPSNAHPDLKLILERYPVVNSRLRQLPSGQYLYRGEGEDGNSVMGIIQGFAQSEINPDAAKFANWQEKAWKHVST